MSFQSCVYGAQTWSLTKAQTEKLQSTQRAMERKILDIGKSDKISKRLKFKYAGYMYREKEGRWNKIAKDWTPYEGKRGRGRPSTRWRDEIRNRVGRIWKRITGDIRDQW